MPSILRSLMAALLCSAIGYAGAQETARLGTFVPAIGAPKLVVFPTANGKWGDGSDICKQCLAGGPTPDICKLLLCRGPGFEAQKKIYVTPDAKEMLVKGCEINRLCVPENFEVLNEWPPKPGDPNPFGRDFRYDQFMKPYKGFLELSRIDADEQLKAGAISKDDYNVLLKAYRSDYKSMKSMGLGGVK